MATTSIISSTEGFIIRTAIIVMITASSIPSVRSFYSGSSNDRSCGARRAMCALPRLIDRGASSDSLAAALAASGIVESPGFAATGCGSGAASDREHQNQLQIPCKRGPPHMLLCLASQGLDDAALRNGSALALVDGAAVHRVAWSSPQACVPPRPGARGRSDRSRRKAAADIQSRSSSRTSSSEKPRSRPRRMKLSRSRWRWRRPDSCRRCGLAEATDRSAHNSG